MNRSLIILFGIFCFSSLSFAETYPYQLVCKDSDNDWVSLTLREGASSGSLRQHISNQVIDSQFLCNKTGQTFGSNVITARCDHIRSGSNAAQDESHSYELQSYLNKNNNKRSVLVLAVKNNLPIAVLKNFTNCESTDLQ